mmetsp:Transcript_18897/g.41802  ORF Transcript_18897/g.41802 Transcript_18897/m.41802 type:complete len:89 (-) Transcript_18897:849-1115(-)
MPLMLAVVLPPMNFIFKFSISLTDDSMKFIDTEPFSFKRSSYNRLNSERFCLVMTLLSQFHAIWLRGSSIRFFGHRVSNRIVWQKSSS